MRILICEDDPISQTILTKILDEYGECDVASDGNEALEKIHDAFVSNNAYDLVCCDIVMPGKDGFDVVSAIRSIEAQREVLHHQEVPIVMISALGHPKNIFAALSRCGASEYIVKPITKTNILEVVDRVLARCL